MTKAEYLAICSQRWEDISNLHTRETFYEYEKDFVDLWQDTGLEVFSKSFGELPKDRRKKNNRHDLRVNRNVD